MRASSWQRCGLSPAAAELAKRLDANRKKKDGAPSKAVKLIDRLKDVQLSGHWAKAVSLFDNYPAESRPWRWQSFHYRCVVQVLLDARQAGPLPRIWDEMNKRPELSLDEECASDCIALAAAGQNPELARSIVAACEERGFSLKMRAQRGLERLEAADWVAALTAMSQKVEVHRLENPAEATTLPDIIARGFNELASRHRKNAEAVQAITAAMQAAGARTDADGYSARIRACGRDWEQALAIMAECKGCVAPRTNTYSELMSVLWAAREAPRMQPVLDDMAAAQVSHDKRSVELAMRHYETTPKWEEATRFFVGMKTSGIAPTNGGYASLIKTYSKGGQSDRVMPVFEAMRKDGFQGNARDTVSLINAWSSNRSSRFSRHR